MIDDLASRTIEDRERYYDKAIAEGKLPQGHFTAHSDRLVLIEDADGDGRADRRTEIGRWNEPVSGLIAGVEVREGDVWVTGIPSVRRLEDDDGDGVPESEAELVRGFGVKTSLIGHDLHGLAWGPDGKLYFSMGDRGYSLPMADGSRIEPSLGPGEARSFG